MNNLLTELQEKIEHGDIAMKPKWQFMLTSALWVSGTLLAAVLLLYVMSFSVFALKESGLLFAPGLGGPGVLFFILASPWILIGTSALFLFLLYILVSHFSFSYRRPLLYTLIAVIALSLLGAFLIERTAMHDAVGSLVEKHQVPLMAGMYQQAKNERPAGVTVGRIQAVGQNGFTMQNEYGDLIEVEITSRTKQPPQLTYATNSPIIVFGNNNEGFISALGVRPVQRDMIRDHVRKATDEMEKRPPRPGTIPR